jgi:DNA-binding phage protein
MTDLIRVRPWDVTDYLETPEHVAYYILEALEEGDPEVIEAVLEDASRALNRIKSDGRGGS